MLEKAILNGWASFQTVSMAFSEFGAIPIPDNTTVIITSLKWYPFLNPVPPTDAFINWKDFFRYNEYQLKIDGKISKNYLQFRNEFKFKWFSDTPLNLDLNDPVDYGLISSAMIPIQSPPIIQDVFFPCNEFIKLTITRNCFIDTINNITGNPQSVANEQDAPNGLNNSNVVLRSEMISPSLQKQYLFPATIKFDGNDINNGRKVEGYTQDIDPKFSLLSGFGDGDGDSFTRWTYQTTPLVELGLVTIQNTQFDKIKSS